MFLSNLDFNLFHLHWWNQSCRSNEWRINFKKRKKKDVLIWKLESQSCGDIICYSTTKISFSSAMAKDQTGTQTAVTPAYMKAISGSLGGIVEASCLQPIDVIKTRLQLDRTAVYRGILHCGSTVYNTEGTRALWKGLTPFATHLTLKYALRMGSNALLQSAFVDEETGKVSVRGRLFSGFGAGVLEALVIVTPFEVRSSFPFSFSFLGEKKYDKPLYIHTYYWLGFESTQNIHLDSGRLLK